LSCWSLRLDRAEQVRPIRKRDQILLRQIDATIETIISADKTLSEKADILISIPGIAKTIAFAMLIVPLMI